MSRGRLSVLNHNSCFRAIIFKRLLLKYMLGIDALFNSVWTWWNAGDIDELAIKGVIVDI